jgi:hypothetical protein
MANSLIFPWQSTIELCHDLLYYSYRALTDWFLYCCYLVAVVHQRQVKVKVILLLMLDQPVCPGVRPPFLFFYLKIFFRQLWDFIMGCPFRWEDMYVVYSCYWAWPAQSFFSPSSTGLMTKCYSLKFETPPIWRARFPYLFHPGTG